MTLTTRRAPADAPEMQLWRLTPIIADLRKLAEASVPAPFDEALSMVEPVVNGSFSGHETFPFRYAWLKKGIDEASDDSGVFNSDDAMTKLGVGKNMVRSIRHWCLAAGMLETADESRGHHLRPSKLGESIFRDAGWDPFLEDPATLWLIHWQICSNAKRSTTWFWAFSHVHEPEFTKDTLFTLLCRWVETNGMKRLSTESLERDIDCLIRTYVPGRQGMSEESLDCPLVELDLIRQAGSPRSFRFNRGYQRKLPDGVLAFATLEYWQRTAEGSKTISLHDLCISREVPAGSSRWMKALSQRGLSDLR